MYMRDSGGGKISGEDSKSVYVHERLMLRMSDYHSNSLGTRRQGDGFT